MRAATKKTLLLLFLALSLPALTAATALEEAALRWNGHDVDTINPRHPTPVTLFVKLSDASEVESLTIDHEQLNPRGETTATIKKRDCLYDGHNLSCPLTGLVIQPSKENPSINITAHLFGDHSETHTQTFAFTIDDTRPEVTFLGTDTCHEGTCYAQSGYTPVTIKMEDPKATFHRLRIAFALDGTRSLVSTCEDTTCHGVSTASCQDGRKVSLTLTTYTGSRPSQDDAGNPLTGITESEVVCDAREPEFSGDPVVTSDAPQPSEESEHPVVAMGDTATIEVNVTESTSPTLKMTADAQSLGGEEVEGSCTQKDDSDDEWTCTVSVEATPSELGTFTIPLTLQDLSGQTATHRDLDVKVVERRTGPADLWTAVDPEPQRANKGFLEQTSKRFFVPLSLDPAGSSQTLVSARMTGTCNPFPDPNQEGETYGKEGDLRFKVSSVTSGTVLLRGVLNTGSHYAERNHLRYNCSLNLQTLKGDYLSTTEEETFTMSFELDESDTMGAKIRDEVLYEMNSTVKSLSWVQTARQTLAGLNLVCAAAPAIKGAGGGLNGAAAGSEGTFISNLLQSIGINLQKVSESGAFKSVNKACKITTCDMSWTGDVLGFDMGEDLGKFGDVAKDVGVDPNRAWDPYSGFAASAMTACVPAMVYHVERYASVDCNYITCLSRDVRNGRATIDMCQQQRGYESCLFMTGGWLSALPVSFIKDYTSTLLEAASNPVALFGGSAIIAFCEIGAGSDYTLPKKICSAAVGLKGFYNGVQELSRLHDQLRKLSNSGQLGQEVCGPVRESVDRESGYWDYSVQDEGFEPLYRTFDSHGDVITDTERINNCKDCTHCNPFTGCSFKEGNVETKIMFSPDGDSSVIYDGSGNFMGTRDDYSTILRESRTELLSSADDWSNLKEDLEDTPYDEDVRQSYDRVMEDSLFTDDFIQGYQRYANNFQNLDEPWANDNPLEGSWDTNDHLRPYGPLKGELEQGLNQLDQAMDKTQEEINHYETMIDLQTPPDPENPEDEVSTANYESQIDSLKSLKKELDKSKDEMSSHLKNLDNFKEKSQDLNEINSEFKHKETVGNILYTSEETTKKYAEGLSDMLEEQGYDIDSGFVEDYVTDLAEYENEIASLKPEADRLERLHEQAEEYKDLKAKDELTDQEQKRLDDIEEKFKDEDFEPDDSEDIGNKLEKVEEDLKEAKKGRRKIKGSLKAEMFVDKNIRGLSRIGTYFSTLNMVNSFSNTFMGDDGWIDNPWSNEKLEDAKDEVESWLTGENICKEKLGGAEGVKANIEEQSGETSTAAFAAGLIKEEGLRDGTEQYSYTLNALVSNSHDNDKNLTFSLRLSSTEGRGSVDVPLEVDEEGRSLTRIDVPPGDSWERILGSMIDYPSSGEATSDRYDQVCLHFHVGDIKDFFDITTSSKKFCRRLEVG
ncbi:MAG: hypothetical protein ACLFO2_04455 [Candidatus Woesearchaeota archaeon]